MTKVYSRVWITWEKQIRNKSLSRKFDAKLYEFDYPQSALPRYIKSIVKTLVVLFGQRPKVVFVQNPSIVLALLAVLSKCILGNILVVDAHNVGLYPSGKLFKLLAKIILKYSSFTIVTNHALADYVELMGGRPLIIPDPLPSFHNEHELRCMDVDATAVLFICSWANDEPYLEVFKAAESLPQFRFYVTGRSKGRELEYGKPLPNNVILTGYLSDDEYHKKLATSLAVIDLTTRENCLVCGAYEATALERPFIVSNKKAIRDYFVKGCVYIENTAPDIVAGIGLMNENYNELKKSIVIGRAEIETRWNNFFNIALNKLQDKMSK